MEFTPLAQLFRFLQDEVGIPADEIAAAQRLLQKVDNPNVDSSLNLLAIVLWQYGLLNLEQLNRVFDWLELSITGQ